MDEIIIFKLFTKKKKTGSLEMVPDALILPGDALPPAPTRAGGCCCTTDFCSTFLWKEKSQG